MKEARSGSECKSGALVELKAEEIFLSNVLLLPLKTEYWSP